MVKSVSEGRPPRMDWDRLRVFYIVAKSGSFTNAGHHLNLSQSAISRQIAALENSLGHILFFRSSRGLVLTESGERLLSTAKEVFGEMALVEGNLSELKHEPAGPLRVTCPVGFGTVWLAPRLPKFIAQHPRIQIDLTMTDEVLDLTAREADAAIRFVGSSPSGVIQRVLMPVPIHLYGSNTYLQKHGLPLITDELRGHHIIAFGTGASLPLPWEELNWMLFLAGAPPLQPVLLMDNLLGLLEVIRNHGGIGALPDFLAAPYIGTGPDDLTLIGIDWPAPFLEAVFLYPEPLRDSKRIEVFRDFLLSELETNGLRDPKNPYFRCRNRDYKIL